MIHGYFYGHGVYFDGENWCYADNDDLAYEGNELYSIGKPSVSKRPCPQCHQSPTPEGYDACLGYIPGAISACCGHGVECGFIVWNTDQIEGGTDWRVLKIGRFSIHLKWRMDAK